MQDRKVTVLRPYVHRRRRTADCTHFERPARGAEVVQGAVEAHEARLEVVVLGELRATSG